MAEAARLVAVAVDLERLPLERPLHEGRDHHPVLAALAGPDGVEEACDRAVEPVLGEMGEREELVHRLRVGVRPAALRRRAVDPACRLVERLLLTMVAVHLGRRGDEDALPETMAVLEHDLGAAKVGHERLHRLLDDQPDADRGGEVVDDVALVDELVHARRLEDAVDDEVEGRAVPEVLDVRERSGREVVERPHFPAVVE